MLHFLKRIDWLVGIVVVIAGVSFLSSLFAVSYTHLHMVATPSVPAHISFCGKSRSKCTPAIHLKFQSPRNVALETFSASRYLTDISISVTLVGISCSDNFAIVYCSNHDDHVMLDGGDP